MGEVLLLLVVALTVAAVVFGVTVLVSGRDPGLVPTEPDGRAVPLPGSRPLRESDIAEVRFDTGLRGYRMAQVDQAMRRAAYDIGYKSELIGVLEAEIAALREGRTEEADALRRAREEAAGTAPAADTATDRVNPGTDGSTADTGTADAPSTGTPANALTAEAGVAEAPAAAAVEDVAPLPSPEAPTPAAPVAPVAAPVDQPASDAALRPPADPTTGHANGAAGRAGGDRERGPVVRSESA
ncbi:DivIVA domain-containing protein [Micromonospora soli]|uniref:DivIVA domain-containing protein n=1 Tax=Micromonospora sp. NBRC 110009 TaxID=3061627 RepID=UPI0026722D69|nr:DivIVA domain-containing protein [Micromonospora sp. NBRC 110009]WKU00393.1 DivIVA domain-containing protein [Micromonospora sp. NBRC 110009]